MKNAGKTEDWLIERASGVWRKDPLRAILELFPFGTDPKYSLVRLQEPWRSRYPNCEYGLDAWACEVCDKIALRVAEHDFDMVNAVDPIRVAVASGHGPGKGAPLDAWVDTPQGRMRWGDLAVGDHLFGADGKAVRITGFPYCGVRPCYRVEFDDGSFGTIANTSTRAATNGRFRSAFCTHRLSSGSSSFEGLWILMPMWVRRAR